MNPGSLQPITLLLGWPSPHLLPTQPLSEATSSILSSPTSSFEALSYGANQGNPLLRKAIANWLSSFYDPISDPITESRHCVTGGASQGLASILQVFTDVGYTKGIWMIEPCYFLAKRSFEDNGFIGKIRGVSEDEEGVDVEGFEKMLRESEEGGEILVEPDTKFTQSTSRRKLYRHVLFCVPTFSNPTGKVMSLRRRKQLVELARKFNMLIICDDVYDMLRWPNESSRTGLEDSGSSSKEKVSRLGVPTTTEEFVAIPPRLIDIERELMSDEELRTGYGHTCSNGSFSKLVAPGLKVGWIEGTESFVRDLSNLGSTQSGGCPSQYTSFLIRHLLQSGDLQKHISTTLISCYQRRSAVLVKTVKEVLVPLGVTIPSQANDKVLGGFFMWLVFPVWCETQTLATHCKEKWNLILGHGSMFEVESDKKGDFRHRMRVCWAFEEEDKLVEGVKRIRDAMLELQARGGGLVT